ncbi:MAG: DNA-directed RNA polymerase subunit A', partial [Candidatus Hydrothermarchaeales archaeon]
ERSDGRSISLKRIQNPEEILDKIETGWIIHRHLTDGDIVLFNRQPSLHRMSIMAHEVKVLPYKTFRLNLCVCPPYNADFDGDEMNMHVIQGEEAIAEAKVLMRVQEQILSPRFGGPIIGGIHDHITGAYLLTKKGSYFTKKEVSTLLYLVGYDGEFPEPVTVDGKELYDGKSIFSLFLPKDMNLSYKAKVCKKCEFCEEEKCPDDGFVTIKNGRLLTGVVDEKAFGAFAGEMLDRIVKDYGTDEARKFLNTVTRVALFAIMKYGFSTGIDDEDLPTEAGERIEEILDLSEEKVQELIDAFQTGVLEHLPGRSLEETLEMRIMQALSEARDKTGSVAGEYLGMGNSAVMMAKTGARGSMLNLTQMAACVGQQAVRGGRISRGYVGRTLPHFKVGERGAKAKGFVRSSYKRGQDPLEYFFHAMGGREGLVDTAVRTSQSGYMQRRLINALQDLKIEYDGTVRGSDGRIVEVTYGGDGADPSRTDWGNIVNVKKIVDKVVRSRT